MLLNALEVLIYKLLMIIFITGIVCTTGYYFILKFLDKNNEKSNKNFRGRNTKGKYNSSKNHCDGKEKRVIKVITNDKTEKELILKETNEVKELKKQASEIISSKLKNKEIGYDDIKAIKNFIIKITGQDRKERHKNDLHFIYSSIKHYEISEGALLKIIYFLKNKEGES